MPLHFPLEIRFRLVALAARVAVYDATGAVRYFMRQKAFKLREDVTIFADEAETTPVAYIRADRVIDFSAQYHVTDASGTPLGVVRRRGGASLWRASYEVARDGELLFTLREANPWVKVLDGIFQQIPVVGLLAGYVLHPRYLVRRAGDEAVTLEIRKQPALFEGRYLLSEPTGLTDADAVLVLYATLMALTLERSRG